MNLNLKPTPRAGDRIAKVMARAGLCSRRDAEKLIGEGRVTVNGTRILSPAVKVLADDVVAVDGNPLAARQSTRLWRYHKPAGLVVSHRDPQGRPTVFASLPADLPRLVSVGRLDINSEGLLLLTNDGELERRLELPATGWTRRYRVRVHGRTDDAALARLEKGIVIDGIRYGPIHASIERRQGTNLWLGFSLTEGKNREIKRVCDYLGLKVTRLIRISFGPFALGGLERGDLEEVSPRVLWEQLGSLHPAAGQRK